MFSINRQNAQNIDKVILSLNILLILNKYPRFYPSKKEKKSKKGGFTPFLR